MFNGLTKVGNDSRNDCEGKKVTWVLIYTPIRGLQTCTAYARWSEP
jgi:hypothetical protein